MKRIPWSLSASCASLMILFAHSVSFAKEIKIGGADTVEVDGTKYILLGPGYHDSSIVAIGKSGSMWLYTFPQQLAGSPQNTAKVATHEGKVYQSVLTSNFSVTLNLLAETAPVKALPKSYSIVSSDSSDFKVTMKGVQYTVDMSGYSVFGDSITAYATVSPASGVYVNLNLELGRPQAYRDLFLTVRKLILGPFFDGASWYIVEYGLNDGSPILPRLPARVQAKETRTYFNLLGREIPSSGKALPATINFRGLSER
jgi:hypothetical protein